MTKGTTAEPTDLEKARQKVSDAMAVLSRAEDAAKAGEWFAKYAGADRRPEEVLALKIEVAAGGTPNVGKAKAYIKRAVDELSSTILVRAMELAEIDFKEALALTEK